MNKEDIEKLFETLDKRIILHEVIREPMSWDLHNLIKLSVAYENLEQENKELHNKIDKAIEELDRIITFCENDSQGGYDICNMAIRNYKNIRSLLKDSDVNEDN